MGAILHDDGPLRLQLSSRSVLVLRVSESEGILLSILLVLVGTTLVDK
jgi:hypothetical protein